MTAYYNENDPFAAAWLRELIARGLIAKGEVDERSIADVRPEDLRGFVQCHFFAGIGGWSYALRLAGWPDDRPVWTGSCPCQPFSVAGQRKGTDDVRHLWPILGKLVGHAKPSVVFGEQVASKAGREWLTGVRADLEALGYAVGAADLCAAGVRAPHIRQRLYWVADSNISVKHGRDASGGKQQVCVGLRECATSVGDSTSTGLQGERREYRPSGERCSGLVGFAVQTGVPEWNGPTVAVACLDGYRRVSSEPESFPLAHGVQRRMGKLRGYGNAIVPQVAAEFIAAYLEVTACGRS